MSFISSTGHLYISYFLGNILKFLLIVCLHAETL